MSNQSNDIPEGFKMTALGLLPEEWKTVRLENAANIIMGQSPPSSTYNAEIIGLPFFQGKADFGDVYPTIRKWCSAPARIAEKNDVLLSVRAPIGDVNMATERCCIGRGLASIRANQNSAGQYLFYRLVFSKELLENKGTGTTFKEINKAAVTSFLLPLPPLPEQKAIARVLSTIQKAIEAQDKIIAAAKEMRKSLMRHLFTYGPVPVAEVERVPIKETEIGPVPQHWEVVKLGEIALARGGIGFPPQYQGKLEGEYPFYKVSDMNLIGNERFMRQANNFVDGNIIGLLKAKPFPPDTIIFPKVGAAVHTNKKRLLTSDALVDNNIMGVTISDQNKCIPEYLLCWFESIDIGEFSNPGPLPSINAHSVKDSVIPLPPLHKQQQIARTLSSVEKKIESEEKRKAALQALFKTMLQQLMTGKVRVKDPEVEVA